MESCRGFAGLLVLGFGHRVLTAALTAAFTVMHDTPQPTRVAVTQYLLAEPSPANHSSRSPDKSTPLTASSSPRNKRPCTPAMVARDRVSVAGVHPRIRLSTEECPCDAGAILISVTGSLGVTAAVMGWNRIEEKRAGYVRR